MSVALQRLGEKSHGTKMMVQDRGRGPFLGNDTASEAKVVTVQARYLAALGRLPTDGSRDAAADALVKSFIKESGLHDRFRTSVEIELPS